MFVHHLLTDLLQSISTFKGDLSAVTVPAFVVSGISLVEAPSYLVEQPKELMNIAAQSDAASRTIAVLKWYLATFRAQFGKRDGRRKKPLNPVLGELFLGHFQDEGGKTEVIIEQVSHHPPITAFRISNKHHGMSLEGYYVQKTYFKSTVRIERYGPTILHIDKWNEDYLITHPALQLQGFIPPPPYMELNKTCYVIGSNDYIAEIDFSGKGWFFGKKHSLVSKLRKADDSKEALFTITGQWELGEMKIRDHIGKEFDKIDTIEPAKFSAIQLRTVEEQDPLESRRVWKPVADAVAKGDFTTVGREKSRIEEEQREARKAEAAEGKTWQPRYFKQVDHWIEAEHLLQKVGLSLNKDDTKGIWRWTGNEIMA